MPWAMHGLALLLLSLACGGHGHMRDGQIAESREAPRAVRTLSQFLLSLSSPTAAAMPVGLGRRPAAHREEPSQPGSLFWRMVGSAPAWAAEIADKASASVLNSAQRKRLRVEFKQKLSKVPVFMVTNEGGSPFLSMHKNKDQAALMYILPLGARKNLGNIMRSPNGKQSGAKVFVTNLERAFALARQPPMLSGLDDRNGKPLKMRWQFQADEEERLRAAKASGKGAMNAAKTVPGVPCYMVDGLVVKKKGKELRPVYLSRLDLDRSLKRLKDKAQKPKVRVYNALSLLIQLQNDIEAGHPDALDLDTLEIIPPTESVEARKLFKSVKKLPAKIMYSSSR